MKIAGIDDERDGSMDNDSQSKDKRQSDLQLLSNEGDRLINSESTGNISAWTCSKSKEVETDNIANRTRKATLNIAAAARVFLADAAPTTVEEAKSRHNKDQWESAIKNEYNSLIQNDTWTLADLPEDRRSKVNGSLNFEDEAGWVDR